jgi:hypothetical protein
VQNISLFGIAILLVAGFYWHDIFYTLGYIPLLIIGSIVVFLVIKCITWSSMNISGLRRKYHGVMVFKPYEMDLIRYGFKRLMIRIARNSRMNVGNVYRAKLNVTADKHFAVLLITDIITKRLGDVTESEVYLDCNDNAEQFIRYWKQKHGKVDLDAPVKVIKFDVID